MVAISAETSSCEEVFACDLPVTEAGIVCVLSCLAAWVDHTRKVTYRAHFGERNPSDAAAGFTLGYSPCSPIFSSSELGGISTPSCSCRGMAFARREKICSIRMIEARDKTSPYHMCVRCPAGVRIIRKFFNIRVFFENVRTRLRGREPNSMHRCIGSPV